MPENDPVDPADDIPQVPLDTDPGDRLVTGDGPMWPYDPDTESVPDEDEEADQ